MVTQEQLKKLAEPIDNYKYRVQSAKYGKATIVSYIDSRQVQDRLDEVCGVQNWQNEFRAIDGSLFGGISINVDLGNGGSEWITKWDVGSESSIEKEKGNSSDSFKRSAVMWGVGRFLYSLGMITLKTAMHKDKEYPATDEGKILWGVDELTEYCKKVVASGNLDRTKPNVPPLAGAKTVAPPAPVAKVEPTVADKTTVKPPVKKVEQDKAMISTPTPPSGALQPSKAFEDVGSAPDDRKVKAKQAFANLDKAKVLNHLIKVEKSKKPSADEWIDDNTIETVLEVYEKVKGFKK